MTHEQLLPSDVPPTYPRLPSLSIIIPSHRRVDLLQECLHSVTQHAPAGTDILVVDDGSPDAVVSRTASQFPNVGVIRLEEQRGFSVAANTGIRASTGEVVELLNDDTTVSAGWVESCLTHFRDASIGAVAPLVLKSPLESDPVIDSAGDGYHHVGLAWKNHHGKRVSQVNLNRRRVFGVSASSAFYRRSALDQVGLFDESMGAYFEDVDLSHRLRRAKFQAIFEPSSTVHHHVGASYGEVPDENVVAMQSRNEELLFWRYLPRGLSWALIPLHFAVLGVKAWRSWRRGRLRAFLRGRLSACSAR